MQTRAGRGARFLALTAACLLVGALGAGPPAAAASPAYPRLAVVYYGDPWSRLSQLASYDLWIGANDPAVGDAIRQLGPGVKLIPYQITTESCGTGGPRSDPGTQAPGFDGRWWLRTAEGEQYRFWRDCPMVNQSAAAPVIGGVRFNEFFARYVHDYLWAPAQGRFDGIYLDNLWEIIAWKMVDHGNSIDLDANGVNDLATFGQGWVDRQWGDGVRAMMRRLREYVGPGALLIGGSALTMDSTNGRIWEDWPNGWDPQFSPVYGFNSWRAAFENYRQWQANHHGDLAYVVLSYPPAAGDYRAMRYGLASTLLGDGYFAVGDSIASNLSLAWYDEYSVDFGSGRATGDASRKGYLGQARGPAVELAGGTWRRDFEFGSVVLNPTSAPQAVDLGEDFRRIHGTQDPAVNNGQPARTLTLPANDGLVLLRTAAAPSPTPIPPTVPAPATPTARPPLPGTNLLANPSFDVDVAGWLAWESTVSQVSAGRTGTGAARLTAAPAATAPATMILSNWPGEAPSPRQGATYSAAGWVRGAGSTIGKRAWLVLREHDATGTGQNAAYSSAVTLGADWVELTVQKQVALPNAANIDVLVQVGDVAPGDAVEIDDVAMWAGAIGVRAGESATPTPTATPTSPPTVAPAATRSPVPTSTAPTASASPAATVPPNPARPSVVPRVNLPTVRTQG